MSLVAQPLILNGDFSLGLTSWTYIRNTTVIDDYAVLSRDGVLRQAFQSTVGDPRETFSLSFDYKFTSTYNVHRVQVPGLELRLNEVVTIGGTPQFYTIGGFTGFTPVIPDTWYHVTVSGGLGLTTSLSLTGGTTSLTTTSSTPSFPGAFTVSDFTGTSGPLTLDNVAYVVTPEPEAALLLLLGLCFTLLTRIRPSHDRTHP